MKVGFYFNQTVEEARKAWIPDAPGWMIWRPSRFRSFLIVIKTYRIPNRQITSKCSYFVLPNYVTFGRVHMLNQRIHNKPTCLKIQINWLMDWLDGLTSSGKNYMHSHDESILMMSNDEWILFCTRPTHGI